MGGNPIQNQIEEGVKKAALSQEQIEAAKRQQLLGETKAAREADYEAGLKRGEEMFGKGSLSDIEGRRAGEIADVIAQRKAQAQGYSPEERALLKEQGIQAQQQSTKAGLRQLKAAQAGSGVRGGLAAAQQAKQILGGQQAAMNAARDLAGQEIGMRRQGLGALEQSIQAARQEELGTLGREKMAQQATALGLAQLGAQERGGVGQQLAAMKAAQASQGGGKK